MPQRIMMSSISLMSDDLSHPIRFGCEAQRIRFKRYSSYSVICQDWVIFTSSIQTQIGLRNPHPKYNPTNIFFQISYPALFNFKEIVSTISLNIVQILLQSQQVIAGRKTVQEWFYLKLNVLNFRLHPQGNFSGQK